jgi:hypothetical protein
VISKERPPIIELAERRLIIGATWERFDKKPLPLETLKLRKAAQDSENHWGMSHHVSIEDAPNATEYTLIDEPEEEGDTPLFGAPIISQHINEWVSNDEGNTLAFIMPVVFNGAEYFWLVAVTPKGMIAPEFDLVVKDRYELEESIDILLLTEELSFVTLDDDNISRSVIDRFTEGKGPIGTISRETLAAAIEGGSQFALKRFYRPSKIKVKKLGLSIAGTVIATGLWAGYVTTSQSDEHAHFDNNRGEFLSASKNAREIKTELKSSKGKKTWGAEEFKEKTLTEFISDMRNNLYDPVPIALVLKEISNEFPLFSSDWEMTKMTYVENKFLVFYKRIEGGKGVYFALDEQIKAVGEKSSILNVKPFSLKEQGQVRIYSVHPKANYAKARFEAIDDALGKINRDRAIRADLRELKESLAKAYGEMSSAANGYNNLEFFDKWFTYETSELYRDAILAKRSVKKAQEKLEQAEAALNSSPPLALDENLVLGSVMDFVTMMQLDSFFDWSFPALAGTYPDGKSIEENNKAAKKEAKNKSRKKKRKKKDSEKPSAIVFAPAIESYAVKVETRQSEEEGKVRSFGLADLLQLSVLLDKPFIQVDYVEYERETEQWVVGLRFFKKTQEYAKYIPNKTNGA